MSRQYALFPRCAALVVLVVSVPLGVAFAQERETRTGEVQLVYAMSSQGYPFGKITLTRKTVEHEGKQVVEEKTVTEMNYTTGTERYSMNSTELAWIGPEGLVKYDATFTENGETTLMKVRWIDDALLVRARLGEGDEWTGVEFEKRQFDFTLPENPPLKRIAQAGGKTTLKWLSLYEMAIAPVKIEHIGKERRKAGNTSFECDIIVFDNPSMGLGGKIWIAQDAVGPFLLRAEGRSPEGPFTMQVTEYKAQQASVEATKPKKASIQVQTKRAGDLQAGLNKVNFKSEGLNISAHLFLPTSHGTEDNLPAIVVVTPASGVKEQTAGIYAKELSERGYITLAFDHRTYGESEGQPRAMENAPMKVEDIKNAISYIRTVRGVDREKVAALGICSGAGYCIQTACLDARIKSLATVSGFIDFIDYGVSGATQYMYQLSGDNIEQFRQQMKIASDARQKYFETGEVVLVDGIPAKGSGMGEFWDRAADYYHNPKRGGAAATYTPKRAAMSLDTRYFFNGSQHIELMRGTPFLAIVGTNAHTAYFSELAVNRAKGDKELHKIKGAHHFDLYDQDEYVGQAVEKLDEFFSRTLANR